MKRIPSLWITFHDPDLVTSAIRVNVSLPLFVSSRGRCSSSSNILWEPGDNFLFRQALNRSGAIERIRSCVTSGLSEQQRSGSPRYESTAYFEPGHHRRPDLDTDRSPEWRQAQRERAEPKRVVKVYRIAVGVPVEVEPSGEADGVFLGYDPVSAGRSSHVR
jgi:hypothetical protein